MALADVIKKLRIERHWRQADLAEKIGVQQKQISGYECGNTIPSTDILIKIAEAFDVSLDYLAFEATTQPSHFRIQDRDLLRRFEMLEQFPQQDKQFIMEIIDLLSLKRQVHQMIDPQTKPTT